MNGEIETIILENLIHNEDYGRKVLPFIKEDYFPDNASKAVYGHIFDYVGKYNTLPTQSELIIELKNRKGFSQSDFESAVEVVNELTKKTTSPSVDWLLEHTEKFCRERALYNSLVGAAEMMENIETTGIFDMGSVPESIQSALGITFDTTVGLDYSVVEDRWERRKQRDVEKVKFSVSAMNEATNGGMNLKTISCVAAATGAGKSAFKCAQAAYAIKNGVDVLYITLEMDEDSITDRIDANLLDIDLDDIPNLSKKDYVARLKKVVDDSKFGRLIVKEYPTACAGVLEFRALLNELRLKKNFTPKLLIVDYLNICSSSRFKPGVVNSYTLVKAIAEELRGLAKEFNVAVLTGTQLNRDGVDNVNVSLKEISESSGLSHTVDFLFAMMRTEELDKLNQVLIKQLKNRFGDMVKKLRFVLGVTRARFKYFDVDESAQVPTGQSHSSEDEAETPAWSGNFGVKPRNNKFGGINTK